MNKSVPFLDLAAPHAELEDELVSVFRDALRTSRFIGGPAVEGFEKDFARFCDAKHCIGVGSGTDALRFALIAAGVKKGDTVITVPNTFIATTEAISQAGAAIGFVDIDERTCSMDPEKLREYFMSKCTVDAKTGRAVVRDTGSPVSAVVPVHLYGLPAHMDPLRELAAKYNFFIVEDACQAHGAEYFSQRENRWKKAGSMGLASAFSFYPGKNLGACGEAGAVTTDDDEIARNIRMLRDHGQTKKYYHEIEGYNGRLDAIQAGLLSVKLKHLAEWNEDRRRRASFYNEALADVGGIMIPHEPEWGRSVHHLYIIRTQKREDLKKYLADNNIDTGLHYPVPLHIQDAYKDLGFKKGDFPVSEKVALEMLSLPMYPGLTEEQQQYVSGKIKEWRKAQS